MAGTKIDILTSTDTDEFTTKLGNKIDNSWTVIHCGCSNFIQNANGTVAVTWWAILQK